MGVGRLCFWLGAITFLVLPNSDARTVKLVPAETKTITTKDGATHEISRFIVMPDDEASSPKADAVTSEKLQIKIIPHTNSAVNEKFSEKTLNKVANENFVDSAYTNVKLLKTDNIKTGKTASLVKLIKNKNNAQGTDSIMTKKEVPTLHDSKTTVYIRRSDEDESNQSHIKDGIRLNGEGESLKAGAEGALRRIAEYGTSQKIERVKTGRIPNPTKITNIKYTELPIKWDFVKTLVDEKADNALLTTIGTSQTFTLPGQRGRFKLIHEDDEDAYNSALVKPLEHTTSDSNPTHQTTSYTYNNMKHSAEKSVRSPDDVDEKNDSSLKIHNIENINQHGHIIPTLKNQPSNIEKADLESYAEHKNVMFGSFTNSNQTSKNSDVSLKLDKYNPIFSPLSDSAVELIYSGTPREVIKTGTDSLENRRHLVGVLNKNNSNGKSNLATEHTQQDTLQQNKVIHISSEKSPSLPDSQSYRLPTLNRSNENSSNVSESYIAGGEPKLQKLDLPIHSKNIITDAKISHVTNISHESHNNLQVLPLANHAVNAELFQVGRLKRVNTAGTKSTNVFASHNSDVVPTGNNSMIEKLKNISDKELPEHDSHQIEIPSAIGNTSTIITFTGSNNVSKNKLASKVMTNSTKTTIQRYTHNSQEFKKAPSIIDLPLSKRVFSYDFIKPTQNLVNAMNSSETKNVYKLGTKKDAEPELVSREDNHKLITSSLPTNKDIVKTNRFISSHEITTVSKVNQAKSNNNTAFKIESDQSNKQVSSEDTNKVEPNVDVVTSHKVDAKNDAESKTVSTKDHLEVIQNPSTTHKNIIATIQNYDNTSVSKVNNTDTKQKTNTELKTENDQSNKQDIIQDTNKAEPVDDVTNLPKVDAKNDTQSKTVSTEDYLGVISRASPTNKKLVLISKVISKPESSTVLGVSNADGNTALNTENDHSNIRSDFEDEIQQTSKNDTNALPDYRRKIQSMVLYTLPRTNINNDQGSLTQDETEQLINERYNTVLNENTDIRPTEAMTLATDNKEKNLNDFDLIENAIAAKATPDKDYDIKEKAQMFLPDSFLEKYPYEGGHKQQSYHVTHSKETSLSHSKLPENNKNKEYGREASVKANPNDQNYIIVADTSYPISPNSYIRENRYQDHDSQTNHKYSENGQRDEIKQKYHEFVYPNEVYPSAIRNTWIERHLQNLAVLDKLRQEQLRYLIQQVKQHETAIEHNNFHPIINDIDNQIPVSNQYYLIPYNHGFAATVATNQNGRLLQDNAELQHYLLKDFDANTINDVRNLGFKVINIINYLKILKVPNAEIIKLIVETKRHLTAEAIDSIVTECQTKAYKNLGERIENIARVLLQKYKSSYRRKNNIL